MNKSVIEKEVLTVSQVADYLQLSEMTTYKLVQEGKIPAFKIGRSWRVKKDDLEELIERLKKGESL
ncbi:MAG: DNA-binding protein [Clostridia bacterium]|jgi:excisionase family DNA binding protein|nr:DNA-binding protein [Clostridia bacterium]